VVGASIGSTASNLGLTKSNSMLNVRSTCKLNRTIPASEMRGYRFLISASVKNYPYPYPIHSDVVSCYPYPIRTRSIDRKSQKITLDRYRCCLFPDVCHNH